jgi:hypothetical protein
VRFVLKDGKRLMVVRPRDSALALKIADEAYEQNYTREQFDAILAQQTYTVVGFLGQGVDKSRPVVLDGDGKKIGYAEPGDSFVSVANAADEETMFSQMKPGDPFIATTKPVGKA